MVKHRPMSQLVGAALLSLFATGCGPDRPGNTLTTRDETQIAALLDRYETALNASVVDAVVEL